MAMSLEQRYEQEKHRLGDPIGVPTEGTFVGVPSRLWRFYNGILVELDGDTYLFSEATVGQLFRAAPGS